MNEENLGDNSHLLNQELYSEDTKNPDPSDGEVYAYPAESISMPSEYTLSPGQIAFIYVTPEPETAKVPNIVWTSSDPGVASIEENTGGIDGSIIHALKVGEVDVLGVNPDDNSMTASCKVVVKELVAADPIPEDIKIQMLQFKEGTPHSLEREVTTKFEVDITPSNATNKTLIWSTSDSNIADVDPSTGDVTAKAIGTVTISAAATDGSDTRAEIQLSVSPILVDSVQMSPSQIEIPKGSRKVVQCSFNPSNADDKTITWASDNDSVASVSSASGLGAVTGISVGTAVISATIENFGSAKTATCIVSVIEAQ